MLIKRTVPAKPADDRTKEERRHAMDLEAAKIILSKLEKYGGDGAAVVEWAKKIIERERERAIEREVGLS